VFALHSDAAHNEVLFFGVKANETEKHHRVGFAKEAGAGKTKASSRRCRILIINNNHYTPASLLSARLTTRAQTGFVFRKVSRLLKRANWPLNIHDNHTAIV
jgi:hypothetical protein